VEKLQSTPGLHNRANRAINTPAVSGGGGGGGGGGAQNGLAWVSYSGTGVVCGIQTVFPVL